MKILVVVDMQNDFITGSLGSEQAKAILPYVCCKIITWDGAIFATQDTHGPDYLTTQEGRNLPVEHCVEGTEGWEIEMSVQAALAGRGEGVICVSKNVFGSRAMAEYLAGVSEETPIEEIQLIGLCTDICVISNAMILRSFLPEVSIVVDAKCCAGVTAESHATALQAMKACQIRVINE